MNARFRVCAHCGKQFYVSTVGKHPWKKNNLQFCSYNCMNAHEKEHGKVRNLDKEIRKDEK